MTLVGDNDRTVSAASLALALLSAVSCLSVILSIVLYPRSKDSFHLQLVNRLLGSDLGISLCIVIYYIMQYYIEGNDLEAFCKVYFPAVIYFFITSYCCTITLAVRFRTMHGEQEVKKAWKPPFPLVGLWLFPLIFSLPIFLLAWSVNQVTTVHTNAAHLNQTCTFNHDTIVGETLDLICFQFPLFCTIVINAYFYIKGVRALSNSPHSVVARQMKRAGGYMLILLVVWVPNIIYNMLAIFAGNNNSFTTLLDLSVLLSSSQGFFDVCVYVWSNGKMRRWLLRNLVCFRSWKQPPRPPSIRTSTTPRNNSSAAAAASNGQAAGNSSSSSTVSKLHQGGGGMVDGSGDIKEVFIDHAQRHRSKRHQRRAKPPKEDQDSDDEDDEDEEDYEGEDGEDGYYDDEDGLEGGGHNNNDSLTQSESSASVQNPLASRILRGGGNIDGPKISKATGAAAPPPAPVIKTKSILIPAHQTGINRVSAISDSLEVDNEKYVRFGDVMTRMISTSTGRASEISLNRMSDVSESPLSRENSLTGAAHQQQQQQQGNNGGGGNGKRSSNSHNNNSNNNSINKIYNINTSRHNRSMLQDSLHQQQDNT